MQLSGSKFNGNWRSTRGSKDNDAIACCVLTATFEANNLAYLFVILIMQCIKHTVFDLPTIYKVHHHTRWLCLVMKLHLTATERHVPWDHIELPAIPDTS